MEHGPLSWRERGHLWMRIGIRAVLIVGALLLLAYAAPPLLSLLGPFVLALVTAWLLNPLVRWLSRKLPVSRKGISLVLIILIFCALGGALYGLGYAAVSQISELIQNWSSVMETVVDSINAVAEWMGGLKDVLPQGLLSTGEGLVTDLSGWLQGLDVAGWVAALAERAPSLVSNVSTVAIGVVVFLMASYFITADYPDLRRRAADQLNGEVREFASTLRRLFVQAFGGYVKSELLLSLGVFFILAVGFLIIGQPYGLLLAVIFAVLDFIPIIGAGTVMVPWAVVDVIIGNYVGAIQLMVIWGIVALFRRLAEPKVLGDQTGLPPILSLLGIYVGMRLGGVLGMIAGPIFLLVLINLGKLGIFRPALDDLRAAARDVMALLKAGRK